MKTPCPSACPAAPCFFPLLHPLALSLGLAFQGSVGAQVLDDPPLPIHLEADTLSGVRAHGLTATGQARLTRGSMGLKADQLEYVDSEERVRAKGHVRFEQGANRIEGPAAEMEFKTHTGVFETPRYWLVREKKEDRPLPSDTERKTLSGQGHAQTLHFEGKDRFRLEKATWSTCTADDPDWYLETRTLVLDQKTAVGTAYGTRLIFKDWPILWWPWGQFPLANQRQSGFLAPTVASTNKTGLDIALPYYWNIAPQYDATFTPRLMGKRGLQLGAEFRYLDAAFHGSVQGEWLPNDALLGKERAATRLYHHHRLAPGLASTLHFNAVSDKRYFEDLSSRLSSATQSQLLREWRLDYQGSPLWQAGLRVQSFQTLEGPRLYRRAPHAFLRAAWPLGAEEDAAGLGRLGVRAQWTRFTHPDAAQAQGARWVMVPEWSLPVQGPFYHLTPRVGVHATGYALDASWPSHALANTTRQVPFVTLEGGLMFERPLTLAGQNHLQTLEPRVFYAYIPHREQQHLPVFDTALRGFRVSSLFSPWVFSGEDRVGDSHHLTLAATSRLLDERTGALRWEATLGHRYHFQPRRVHLPTEPFPPGTRADLLAGFVGEIARHTRLEAAWHHDLSRHQHPRFEAGLHYQPGFARSTGVAYRYLEGAVRDVEAFVQWPLSHRWHAVGRYTRSLREGRNTEALAGFEYNAGCWVFRTAFHRFATGPHEATHALYFQLELGGLASLGASPVNLLRRSVPGYGKIDGLSAQPVFANP